MIDICALEKLGATGLECKNRDLEPPGLWSIWLAQGDVALFDVGFRLNDILLSALARTDSFPYGKPRDAFTALVSGLEE